MLDLIYLALGVATLLVFVLYALGLKRILTMIVQLIYAVGALTIGVYMVAALLRPDKF